MFQLQQMKDYIGYPDYLDNPKSLEQVFDKVLNIEQTLIRVINLF